MHSGCAALTKCHRAQKAQLPLCCYQQTKLLKPFLRPSEAKESSSVSSCSSQCFDHHATIHRIKIFSISPLSCSALQQPSAASMLTWCSLQINPKCLTVCHLGLPALPPSLPQCVLLPSFSWGLQTPEFRSKKALGVLSLSGGVVCPHSWAKNILPRLSFTCL